MVAPEPRRRQALLAPGFEIGVATAWRQVHEAIALLSAAAGDLDTAMRPILIPSDRVADQEPYGSGKHKRHE